MNTSKTVLVLDTAGFLSKIQLQMYSTNVELYTTFSVLEEVKDRESRDALEISLLIDRVKIIQPSKESLAFVSKTADLLGYGNRLSKTDIEVASLAFELKKSSKVTVLTDDYDLQNLLIHLGIEFMPIKTIGIKEPRVSKNRCRVCGSLLDSGVSKCPICGGEPV